MTMDTSIFAYFMPTKPIKTGGYTLTTYRKGKPEAGFFDSWQDAGNDWYKCFKRYDGHPGKVVLPAGVYEWTQLSEDVLVPTGKAKVRKARYFNHYLTDAEVDEQVAQMRSEK